MSHGRVAQKHRKRTVSDLPDTPDVVAGTMTGEVKTWADKTSQTEFHSTMDSFGIQVRYGRASRWGKRRNMRPGNNGDAYDADSSGEDLPAKKLRRPMGFMRYFYSHVTIQEGRGKALGKWVWMEVDVFLRNLALPQ